MKQRKHFSVLLLTFALFFLMTALCVSADAGGKPTKITAKSSKTLTVAQGSTFELKVRMKPGNADDDYLTWSIISGKSVVQFRDSDRNDDDIKLKAIKTGTAKVRCKIRGTNKKVTFTIKVKKASSAKKITRIGSAKRTVTAGDELELKVRRTKVSEDELTWQIVSGRGVVCFEDHDLDDDEIELKALKAGTAKVRCKIRGTSKKVDFTITVKAPASAGAITRKGSESRTVYCGQEFELEVRRGTGVRKSDLRWTISDTSIVDFEDYEDDADDEAELIAMNPGTVTVTCEHRASGSKVKFTVKVK